MWGENTLDQGHYVGAVEDVELSGIFLKDLCECEPFCCTSSIVGRIERDVGRRCQGSIWRGRFNGDETLGGRRASSGRA